MLVNDDGGTNDCVSVRQLLKIQNLSAQWSTLKVAICKLEWEEEVREGGREGGRERKREEGREKEVGR